MTPPRAGSGLAAPGASRPPRRPVAPCALRAHRPDASTTPVGRPQAGRPHAGRPPIRAAWAPGIDGVAPPERIAEDEELVAGRRPVEEAFAARRPSRRLLVVPERRAALEQLVLHATALRIPVVEVEGGSLTALTGFDGHQGIALVVEPRRWATIEDVMARARERGEPPFVLVLDSLEDPQNVGTLLRSAEACGVHGVVFPTRRSAPIGPAAIKASAGAVEHLLLVPLDDLGGGLVDLHASGPGSWARTSPRRSPIGMPTCGPWRWSWGARGGASRATSDGALTSPSGSPCTAAWGRSTLRSPGRCSCSRPRPSDRRRHACPSGRRHPPDPRRRRGPPTTTTPTTEPSGPEADEPADAARVEAPDGADPDDLLPGGPV
ncbi:MAG: RNA methyltransferase [Chloroflexota bacterium]